MLGHQVVDGLDLRDWFGLCVLGLWFCWFRRPPTSGSQPTASSPTKQAHKRACIVLCCAPHQQQLAPAHRTKVFFLQRRIICSLRRVAPLNCLMLTSPPLVAHICIRKRDRCYQPLATNLQSNNFIRPQQIRSLAPSTQAFISFIPAFGS